MEYASSVWDPFHKLEIDALESVQKFGLRMYFKSWNESYDDLLERAKVPPLKMRREQMKLCHLFKIIKMITEFPNAPVTPRAVPYKSRSINSVNTISIPWANILSYQQSFFPHTLKSVEQTTYITSHELKKWFSL